MAQVHFDEDTPHLQVYFLPVVNEVKRKCYQRDKDDKITSLSIENDFYKNNKQLIKSEKIRHIKKIKLSPLHFIIIKL